MNGQRIKDGRQKLGLRQQDLAERLGVHTLTVSAWERGIRIPRADHLIRLADVLEVSAGELLSARAA